MPVFHVSVEFEDFTMSLQTHSEVLKTSNILFAMPDNLY